MGGEAFEGEDVVGGEADDGGWVEGPGELACGDDGEVEGLGGLVVGDEDEGGGFFGEGLEEEGQVEGARGEGETGDAAPPEPGLEMAADAVVGVGEFEVGEEVADKGQDHAWDQV